MFIIDAIAFSWSVYGYLGLAHSAYTVYNYGKDGLKILTKISSYFAGSKKKEPDLTDSFLIEKKEVENNWELIKFYRFRDYN